MSYCLLRSGTQGQLTATQFYLTQAALMFVPLPAEEVQCCNPVINRIPGKEGILGSFDVVASLVSSLLVSAVAWCAHYHSNDVLPQPSHPTGLWLSALIESRLSSAATHSRVAAGWTASTAGADTRA